MGFGPNAGITIGTRCGDIDYATIFYAMKKTGMSVDEIDNVLNKKSGLLGISEQFSDSRDIEDGMNNGDELCTLANTIYVQKVVNYIAEYFVKLEGKVDAIVFTAGTGENAREIRKTIVDKLNCLGIYLDRDMNSKIASYLDIKEGVISTPESKVPVYVIPTDEEVVIARDAFNFVK